MTSLVTSVFESFKETGYSKQILKIGVTECDVFFDFFEDFMDDKNFDVNIHITKHANKQNAQDYF